MAAELKALLAAALDPEKCEGTNTPWWFIFDPRGIHARAMGTRDAIDAACLNVWGPFFSREAAQAVRERQRHNLSDHAIVWCGSAHMSPDYKALLALAVREAEATAPLEAELSTLHQSLAAARRQSQDHYDTTVAQAARISELEEAVQAQDGTIRTMAQAAINARARIAELEALTQSLLTHNGGPIDASDTINGIAYVMVRESDFLALEAALEVKP